VVKWIQTSFAKQYLQSSEYFFTNVLLIS